MATMDGRRGWIHFPGYMTLTLAWMTFCLIASLARAAESATQDEIEAVWKPHELIFEYRGYDTFYTCSGLRDKLGRILRHLGARRPPELRAYDCNDSTGVVRFQVMFESPLEATEKNVRELTTYDSRELLLARTRAESLPTAQDLERFPATWKTVSFANDRKLGLDPGDCQLVQQLRHQILTRMSIQVLRTRRCSAFRELSRPGLTVSALVATR